MPFDIRNEPLEFQFANTFPQVRAASVRSCFLSTNSLWFISIFSEKRWSWAAAAHHSPCTIVPIWTRTKRFHDYSFSRMVGIIIIISTQWGTSVSQPVIIIIITAQLFVISSHQPPTSACISQMQFPRTHSPRPLAGLDQLHVVWTEKQCNLKLLRTRKRRNHVAHAW